MSPLAHLVALPVRAYRLLFSPWVGHGCRYHPTCSAYELEALEKHGGLKGGCSKGPTEGGSSHSQIIHNVFFYSSQKAPQERTAS